MQETFGSFISAKRHEKQLSIRKFAWLLDFSSAYIESIEKDRKPAPKDEALERIALLLVLSAEDTVKMYDLAAASKNLMAKKAAFVSRDLPEYIMRENIVRTALRTAMTAGATDEDWLAFIDRLNKRSMVDLPQQGTP